MNYVPIKEGDFVLAWSDGYQLYDDDMVAGISRLIYRGAGWDRDTADRIFEVHRVTRVMPKTLVRPNTPTRWDKREERHEHRSIVIAAGATEGAMIALRDRLFAIGNEASEAIEAEASRILELHLSAFEAATRLEAMRNLRRALPYFFGGE